MQIVCFALHLLSPPLQHFIGNVCVSVCATMCVWVSTQGAVCVFTVHTAVLGWRGLAGTALTPCHNDGKGTGKEKLRHLFTARRERALQTLTPLTTFVPHPCQAHKGQREHNETVIINTIRAEQATDTLTALPKWPLLSKPLRVDLPNVRQKSKTGPEAVKQDIVWGKKQKGKIFETLHDLYCVWGAESVVCVCSQAGLKGW